MALTKTCAKENGKKNITCNAIVPGFIDTEMTRGVPEKAWDIMVGKISMGRAGTPEDIGNMIAFLASDEASYITQVYLKWAAEWYCKGGKMSERIVIVSGCRTAVGKFGGALKDLEATDLGGIVIKEAVKRSGLKPEDIEEVVYGCVGQAAENAFAARLASVKAGIPYEATALTVNRLCSSGLQAIVTAAQEIESGMCEIAVAGGCESMTNIPFYLRKARYGYRMGHGELEDGLITALSDPFTRSHMGITAENVANQYNVTRQEQDRWAAISQQRASKAQEEGKFDSEIVPIEVKVSKKETMILIKMSMCVREQQRKAWQNCVRLLRMTEA